MHTPPQESTRRSMLRFLARRKPTIPSLASMSREMGSMPFWVITTKPLSLPSHTFFFSAITLPHHVVGVLALRRHHALALLRVAVHEARVHLRLFVLHADVARQDEGVVHVLLHVWVPSAVIEHQTGHEARIAVELVSHVHDLHHVKVDGSSFFAMVTRVHHDGGELIGADPREAWNEARCGPRT